MRRGWTTCARCSRSSFGNPEKSVWVPISNCGVQIGFPDACSVSAGADDVQHSSVAGARSKSRRRWTRALVATAIGYLDRAVGVLARVAVGMSRGLVTLVSREDGAGNRRAIRRSTSTALFVYAAVAAGAL